MVGRAAGGLALALLLVHLGGDAVRDALIYDRGRAGELWRLVSASFVHYDLQHLLSNLLALLVLGSVLERETSSRRLIVVAAATVLATGPTLHVLLPEYARFAGASCLAYAFLGHLLTRRWGRQPRLTCALAVITVAYVLATALDVGWFEGLHGRPQPAWQLHLLALGLGAAFRKSEDIFGLFLPLWKRGSWRGIFWIWEQNPPSVPPFSKGGSGA